MKVASEYNWTDAGTPQGRERLKELLDSGIGVITLNPGDPATGQPFVHTWKYGEKDLYNIHKGMCFPNSAEWDTIMERVCGPLSDMKLLFLDPSPRLEPKPLPWDHPAVFRTESRWILDDDDGDGGVMWSFCIQKDGFWQVTVDDQPIAKGSRTDGDFETAKAAIHEWRVNHLKSILG